MLDNLSTGKRENLTPWLDQIELIEGDIVRLRLRREHPSARARDKGSAERLTNVRDAETVRRAMAGHKWSHHQVNAAEALNILLAYRAD